MTSSGRKIAIAVTTMVVVAAIAIFELSRLGGDDGGNAANRPNVPAAGLRSPSGSDNDSPRDVPSSTSRAPKQPGTPYVVARGDTITSIARRFEVSTAAIIAANELTDPDRLAEGQRLVIPPPPPVELTLDPTSTTGGQPIEFRLTGAKPGENVTFTVTTPAGTFTGPPHTASQDGAVAASYTPDPGAPGGIGTVTAVGDRGTTARGTFGLIA
jgi:LysM repeat protein